MFIITNIYKIRIHFPNTIHIHKYILYVFISNSNILNIHLNHTHYISYIYLTMLSAHVNASDMEGAEKFFKRFGQDGLEPNVVTYGTLIKGYAKINNLDKMMEKYEEMRKHGIKANQTIFTTIMDAYGRNKDFGSAVIWYKEMKSCGAPPDQKAKNILLSLAKTEEEQNEARELVGDTYHDKNAHTYDDEDGDEDSDEDEDDDNEGYDAEEEKEVELMVFDGNYQQNEGGLHALSLDKL